MRLTLNAKSQSCKALMTVSMMRLPLLLTCFHRSKCTWRSKALSDPSTPPVMACLGASLGAVHFFRTISAKDERCELRPMSRSLKLFRRSPPDAAEPRDWRDLRVMPLSLSLSSMDAPMERPRIFVDSFVGRPGGETKGCPWLGLLSTRCYGSGQELAPRRRRRGRVAAPRCFVGSVPVLLA